MAQEPAAGVSTRRERSVKVWVSGGPRSLVVPALNGESERTAQLRLQQEGLEVGAGGGDPVGGLPRRDGRRAGAAGQGTAGAQVALLVNRGERGASYVMPDLIGVNGDRAAELLRGRGFRVAVVGDRPVSRRRRRASSSGRARRPASRSRRASRFRSR